LGAGLRRREADDRAARPPDSPRAHPDGARAIATATEACEEELIERPAVGGTPGKGRGEIVACRASWREIFGATAPPPWRGRATRLRPLPAAPTHPTQAWATEGAAPDGNRGPNGGRPRRCAPLPPPAAAPGPPFPQALARRLPAPPPRPPPTTHPRRLAHLPQPRRRRVIYTQRGEQNPAGVGPAVGLGRFPSVASTSSVAPVTAPSTPSRPRRPQSGRNPAFFPGEVATQRILPVAPGWWTP
jgi:hypothetical protein